MLLTEIDIHPLAAYPLVAESDQTSLELLQGLQKAQKELPTKLFYDQRGSLLFDQICKLEEYYPTRTEWAIMQQNIHEITSLVGQNSLLIEYGSGSSLKTRLLLDHLPALSAYLPVDISKEHLYRAVDNLSQSYPDLVIVPICADFTKAFSLPLMDHGFSQKLAYFPGSTIGNFHPRQAVAFLRNVAALVGRGGGFLFAGWHGCDRDQGSPPTGPRSNRGNVFC